MWPHQRPRNSPPPRPETTLAEGAVGISTPEGGDHLHRAKPVSGSPEPVRWSASSGQQDKLPLSGQADRTPESPALLSNRTPECPALIADRTPKCPALSAPERGGTHDFKDPSEPDGAGRWISSEGGPAACWSPFRSEDARHAGAPTTIDLKDPRAPDGAVPSWISPELLDFEKPKTSREALQTPAEPPTKGPT